MANANDGRRAVVQDPLAQNAAARAPDRSLQIANIHAPHTPSAQSLTNQSGLVEALQGVDGVLAKAFENKKDDWITEGKVMYQSGKTEQEMLDTGNAFTAQGYRTLQARDKVNQWYTEQTIALDQGDNQLDPQAYSKKVLKSRSDVLAKMPDEVSRKVASAAFEDMSPRLVSAQAVKNSEYNRGQSINAFTSMLSSTASTSSTASRKETPDAPLALSPVPVAAVVSPSAKDRDVGIRTMLGEAASEGTDGLAAVAHVLRNRASDARWGGSIASVALAPKQFSAWNAGPGGNDLVRNYGPGNPMYERAGEIFDGVMSGRHVDPTGGATHYYSPAGMKALVREGSQTNEVPRWLDAETKASGGQIKIGGHIFVGRSGNTAGERSPAPQVTATTLGAGTGADINAVPAQEGVAKLGTAQAAGPNEAQQLIYGYKGLNDADKATAVADAMRRSLDTGNDSLFRDGGGIATLNKLGAKPNEVDEVIKAKKRFDDKAMSDFNIEKEKFSNSIMERAKDGDDLDKILTDIDDAHKKHLFNDSYAQSLAQSAAAKIRSVKDETDSKLGNIDMLNEVGGVYQQIASGAIDFKTAANLVTGIAKKYDASEKDIKQLVTKTFSEDQSYKNKMREQAKVYANDKAEQDQKKAEVDLAIAKGTGLSNITGTQIKVINNRGQEEKVSPQDYGVKQIKDRISKDYTDKITRGELSQDEAKTGIIRDTMLELQKHGVVDKETVSDIHGGLSGELVDKNGKLSERASNAYDAWLTMRTTPAVNMGYLTQLVPNEKDRSLLEQAYQLNSGHLNNAEALLKASEMLNAPDRDPSDKINRDVIWDQKLKTDLGKKLLDRTSHGFLSNMFQTQDRSNREAILRNTNTATKFVNDMAEVYHQMNRREDPEVSMEKALQDLHARANPVLGNLVLDKPGKELADVMGVKSYGNAAVEDAVSEYVAKYGPQLWKQSWNERVRSSTLNALSTVSNLDKSFSPQGIAAAISPGKFDSPENYKNERPHSPPVHITYDAEQGIMSIGLYKDDSRKQVLDNIVHIKVQAIGKEYIKNQNSIGTWTRAWDGMFKGAGKQIKEAADFGQSLPPDYN